MIDLIARQFRTLGEPYRLRLLQELQAGEKTVNEMVDALEGNQPNVSKHLKVLNDAGLVSRRKEGTSVVYGISDPTALKLCQLVSRNETRKGKLQLKALIGNEKTGATR